MSLSKENSLARSLTVNLYRGLSRSLTGLVSPYIPGFTTEKALASVAVVLVIKKIIQIVATQRRHHELLERSRRKRRERDNQILREFTPNIELPEDISTLVLNSTVSELLQLLNQDRVTSEQILKIYHNRAITIGARLELIAESNFTEALELAKQCDETRRNTPKENRDQLGHLFGVPIAIKDSIRQKGLDSTCGLAKNCFNPCTEDGPLIKALKAQGAIPFIRSNVCQALAAFDSANHIWGRSLNPWNLERTPGGSSGGDSGLVAAKCAPIGYGTDFYGSIRIPATFTGTYGLRATSGRFSVSSQTMTATHDPAKFSVLRATSGPIGRCVEDLVLVTKSLITPENKNTDPLYPYIPWNEEKYRSQEKLRIGYVESADFFGTSKPCKRAVQEAVAALKRAGHEVVEIRIPNFDALVLHVFQLIGLEAGHRHPTALDGEKPVPEIKHQITASQTSNLTKRILKLFCGKRFKNAIDQTMKMTANDAILAISRLCILRDQFLRYWTDWRLDAIVTPVCALPAFKHEYGTKLMFATCYAWLGNITNAASGAVPITKVQPGEDVYTSEDTIYNDDLLFKYSQKCMDGSVGLPVGVQVMALPYEDEKCLRIMKILQDEVKFHELPTVN